MYLVITFLRAQESEPEPIDFIGEGIAMFCHPSSEVALLSVLLLWQVVLLQLCIS